MRKLNGYIFWIKIITYWKNIILFGIKWTLILKKEFDSQPVYNKIFLKTETKSYGYEVTDFHDKEILKVDSNCTCLVVISLDSIVKRDENYYPQVFLKSVNTLEKVIIHITDNLKSSSDDFDYSKKE